MTRVTVYWLYERSDFDVRPEGAVTEGNGFGSSGRDEDIGAGARVQTEQVYISTERHGSWMRMQTYE